MARRVVDKKTGKVRLVELSRPELAQAFGVAEEDLARWAELIPFATDEGAVVYRYASEEELRVARERAQVLSTRMSIEAVRNIEADGRLSAYAALAAECPAGITAHVYRSFVVAFLVQYKTGLMLDAEGLAIRAGLNERDPATGEVTPSPDLARKHLRLLQAVGLLRNGADRWEFSRPPACVRTGK